MPDDLTPVATESPAAPAVADAPAPAVDTPAAQVDPYDAALADLFSDPGDEAAEIGEQPRQSAQTTPQMGAPSLTDSEIATLTRAKIDPAWLSGRTRAEVEGTVSYLRQMQADQDRLGAEVARLKPATPDQQAQQVQQPQQAPAAPPSPFGTKVKETMDKLAEVYEGDIGILGELFTELHTHASSGREQMDMVPVIAQFVTEMAVEAAIDGLATQYPSVNTPEGRKQVSDRFWTEWNTGEYMKPDTSYRQQIRSAAENAAKVAFSNTSEQSAAANLVTANKARVASQPKVGSPVSRQQPLKGDELYDHAFAETIGKELRGQRR